jgi:uncharacterized protein (TIGR00255 family)
MTGYAERTFVHKAFSVKISIRTLNHRFLDWNYRGTPLGALEDKLRNLCQQKLHRGRIEVLVDAQFFGSEKWEFRINEDLLEKIIANLEKASSLVQDKITFSLENLLSIPHIMEFWKKDFTPLEGQFIEGCFDKTLNQLIRERTREGTDIKNQLKLHAKNIMVLVNLVEKRAAKQPHLIRQKLKERLDELDKEKALSESRLEEEASFLAQRYDLTEEVARLKSHVRYFKELIESKKPEPVGKKMDFLAQELYRETNTLNSKAQDIKIIQKSLALKSELESVRQQLQNIE